MSTTPLRNVSAIAVTSTLLFSTAGAARAQDPCGTGSVLPSPSPTAHVVLEDVLSISPDDAWAVGRKYGPVGPDFESQTLALHWNGADWSVVPTPSPTPYPGGGWCDPLAIGYVSPTDIWAAGDQRVQAPDGYVGTQILIERWNGSAWSVMPAPMTVGGSGNFVDDIEVIAADDIWFVGDWLTFPPANAARREALTMHWDGSGFTIVPAPFFDNAPIGGHGLTAISAVSSDDIWAVGGGHDGDYVGFSYIVHWDGSEWDYVPGPTAGWFHRLYDVEAVASDDVYAVGDYQDASGYHVLFMHWDGASWTRLPDPPVGGSSLEVMPEGRVYIGGGGVVVWDGAGFSALETFPSVLGPSVSSLAPIGPCSLWAVGRKLEGDDIASFTARLEPGDPAGVAYCTSSPNSAGGGAFMTATGTTSVAAHDLALWASGCPADQPGLFYRGTQQVQFPFGDGVRCVGGTTHRLPVLTTSASGTASQLFDPSGPGVVPGSTWHFQLWYRDPQAGGAGFNLSDARSFLFLP